MESNTPGQNSTCDSSDVSRISRVIFLSIFTVVSFVGSLVIIIVLVHNVKLRSVQNLIIASMCVTCIVDCIFNMILVLSSLVANEWVYGAFMCKINNFFMNLVAIKTILMLTALSTDQYLSQRFVYKYNAWLSTNRIKSVIAYVWVHSLAFSIPFLTDAVKSAFRSKLCLCTVEGETSLALLFITFLVCFFGPSATITIIHVHTCRLVCKLRFMKTTEVIEKNYTQMRNESPQTSLRVQPSLYTVVLFLLWLILEVPFTMTSYIKQYEYSHQIVPGTAVDYPWEVGAIFLWMRFFFSAVFPCVTFIFKKEIWQSTKECVLCRRHNSIVDMNVACKVTGKKESAQKIENDASSKAKDRDKDNSETPSSLTFNVPVLFATSTGICIEDASTGLSFGESENTIGTTDTFHLKGKTLDISYNNYEYADELMGDTSDYDSSCEIDQYSSSQPVSTKNVLETLQRTRSMSDPEISFHHGKSKVTDKSKDLCVTFIGDSGLDLSGTGSSSLEGTVIAKSKISLTGESAPRSSLITETTAVNNTGCHLFGVPDPHSETLLLQGENKDSAFLNPSGSLDSPSPADNSTFARPTSSGKENVNCTITGIKQARVQNRKRSGSSPHRRQSKVSGERERTDSATNQRRSNKPPSSKINNERKHDIPHSGQSGRK